MKVDFIEGKKHQLADALSRAPLFAPPEDEDEREELACRSLRASVIENMCKSDETCCATCGIATTMSNDCGTGIDKNLLDLIDKAKSDKDYQQIVTAFKKGDLPEKSLKAILPNSMLQCGRTFHSSTSTHYSCIRVTESSFLSRAERAYWRSCTDPTLAK